MNNYAKILGSAALIIFMVATGAYYLFRGEEAEVKKNSPDQFIATADNRDSRITKDTAPLTDFNKADYDTAIASDKLVVLYFYANWCPICRAEFPVMQKVFQSLTTDKVVGFRVNYNDNQTDNDEIGLARQFGVAYQHTKVFIKNGARILKSPEGWDEERYKSEINKALTD